jgi:hypothetical protein
MITGLELLLLIVSLLAFGYASECVRESVAEQKALKASGRNGALKRLTDAGVVRDVWYASVSVVVAAWSVVLLYLPDDGGCVAVGGKLALLFVVVGAAFVASHDMRMRRDVRAMIRKLEDTHGREIPAGDTR